MKRAQRWRRLIGGVVGAVALAAPGVSAGAGEDPPPAPEKVKSTGRYACLDTASRAELHVDLASGENGAWQSELTLTVQDGDSQLQGAVFDVEKVTTTDKATTKRKPPQLRLKTKLLDGGQRTELLQGLETALKKPEEKVDCPVSTPQNVKLSWVCVDGETRTAGNLSLESERCPAKTKGYTRAVGVADWAVTSLKRYGAR